MQPRSYNILILIFISMTFFACNPYRTKLERQGYKVFQSENPSEKELNKLCALQEQQLAFLEKNIFQGLKNLNDGFDSEEIKYFSEDDFQIVLKRVESHGIGITGIEPWKNGEFFDVAVVEDFSNNPGDPKWYNEAFEAFKAADKNLQYAASYSIPDKKYK